MTRIDVFLLWFAVLFVALSEFEHHKKTDEKLDRIIAGQRIITRIENQNAEKP